MNIAIKKNNLFLGFKDFIFPGGEVGIKLDNNYKYQWEKAEYQTIIARIQNSEDLISLAMVKDALQEFDKTPINLFLAYVPYGRQDRICDKGEAFSLKIFVKFIASLNFNLVTIVDPHSEVTPAIFKTLNVPLRVITQFDVINKYLDFTNANRSCILVSPDAGSNKKTAEIAKYFEHNEFIRADKLRDLTNGNIKETIVYCDDFKGRDVLVCDDICDGGRTFLELAKVCKTKNCGKFILYVTHGIFSKGLKILYENGIDEIFTTNSFRWKTDQEHLKFEEKINILNLEERFVELL